jgi:Glycosyltransferase family 87
MNTVRFFDFPNSIRLAFAVLVAATGTLYLMKAGQFALLPGPWNGYDFRAPWIAGRLWASGQNPYGEAFTSEYLAAFGAIGPADFFNYPSYWFPIAVPLSFLPFRTAYILWQLLNFVLLLAATALTSHILTKKKPIHFWTTFLVGLSFATLMQSTVWAFLAGQTSILLYFGLAAIFYGLYEKNQQVLMSGLIAVALKPNIGAVLYLLIATMPEWRKTLAVAICVLVLAAMPAVIHDPSGNLFGFLANLDRYYGFQLPPDASRDIAASEWIRIQDGNWVEFIANAPTTMIGLFHFTDALPRGLTSKALIAAAAIVSVIVYRRGGPDELRFARITLVILLFVPLHIYDMVMLMIPALFLWSRGITDPRMLPALAGLLICLRPGNIAKVLDIMPGSITQQYGTLPATIGLLLVAIPFLIGDRPVFRQQPTKSPIP